LLIIARAVNNLCPQRLPNEWLFPCAVPQPHSRGVQMAVNCVIRETCILTHLPRAARREMAFMAALDDQFFRPPIEPRAVTRRL